MKRQLCILSALQVPFGLAVLVCALVVSEPFAITASDSAPLSFTLRLVVTEGTIGSDVNEKDANVAMQAWKEALVKQTGFLIDVHVSSLAKAIHEIRDHQVDGFTVNAVEFQQVEAYAGPTLIMDEALANGGDEYLLLVHDDSGIRSIADLRRKSVNLLDTIRMCLSDIWLETLFASANVGRPQEFLGRMSSFNRLSSVVLPVYFRQVDACLVTRRGFNTMCELNPQLVRKLRILASSPNLVTSLMAFQKDYVPDRRQRSQNALIGLHKSVAGQQVLTLFESSRLVTADVSAMRSVKELFKEYDRIHPRGTVRK